MLKIDFNKLRSNCMEGKYSPEMLLNACKGFEFLEPWIILSVTKNISYDRLEYTELGRIPVSRTSFYRYRKLFYCNLDMVLKENIESETV